MILRRVTQHVKEQNWFAVGVDFLIVVVGVFIGIQVANWNDARTNRVAELGILERLETEYQYQITELDILAERLAFYRESAKQVTMALKSNAEPENREQFSLWPTNALNIGRPPARSASYVQLLSSGKFDLLSNANLRDLLVKYDQSIERNSFVFNQTLALVLTTDDLNAATNSNFETADHAVGEQEVIVDFDFEALKPSEGKVEWLYYMHTNNLRATKAQLALAKEIIAELEITP